MINPKNGINVVSNNNLLIVCSFTMILLLLLFIPHQVVFAANTFVEENPSIAVLDACTPFSYHVYDTITSTHNEPNGPNRPDIIVNSTYTCGQALSYMKEFCSPSGTYDYCNDARYQYFLVHDFGTPAFEGTLGK